MKEKLILEISIVVCVCKRKKDLCPNTWWIRISTLKYSAWITRSFSCSQHDRAGYKSVKQHYKCCLYQTIKKIYLGARQVPEFLKVISRENINISYFLNVQKRFPATYCSLTIILSELCAYILNIRFFIVLISMSPYGLTDITEYSFPPPLEGNKNTQFRKKEPVVFLRRRQVYRQGGLKGENTKLLKRGEEVWEIQR